MQFRILQLLKCGEARDALSLADVLLVGETAVRQHLAVLESAGLVTVVQDRGAHRGRPRNIYVTTPLAARYVPDASFGVVTEFLRHEAATEPEALRAWFREAIAARARALAGDTTVDADARMRHCAEAGLKSGLVLVRESAPGRDAAVRVYECPIAGLARALPMVCDIEFEVLRELWPEFTGIRRDRWKLAGDAYCQYSGMRRDAPCAANGTPEDAFEPAEIAR